MKEIKHTLAHIESLRREKVDPTLRLVPTADGVDYAGAGLMIQHAMAALDEGIPGRQRLRVQYSLMALLEGAADLMRWAQANNFFSDEAVSKGYKAAMAENERLHRLVEAHEDERARLAAELAKYTEAPSGEKPTP